MTYTLYIGDFTYSSWSLRGWLLFEKFGIPRREVRIDFNTDDSVADQLAALCPPARTVPTVVTEDGAILSESLSLAEELASRHPEAHLWPSIPLARATARTLTSEMHAGFTALRGDCPMNLATAYLDSDPSDAVLADLARLETIWSHARATCRPNGPWLCGDYSIVDAFYAPVAARLAGYNLPMGQTARAYVAAHLADPAFRRWRAMGLAKKEYLPWYAKDYPTRDWPGPTPRVAKAVDGTEAENGACPYSGKPITHVLEMEGRRFGFCNAFCRDKTVADPTAWPAFMALVEGQ
ncbi:glutathione S-transferase [Shimia aestuarii]|uniref:glutathione S-transferase n=1 Tax=Shimia aestuarii TaxID=254406 RepID=UPI001FB386C0|nr:glutathione S-transferase [Shimia aestuarii]